MAHQSRGAAGTSQLRRMFDKVMKDANTTFDARRDGPKFMKAALEFKDDPVDLLYRLTKPQEHGSKRLKVALSCSDDPGFIREHLLPFLELLGCDALGRGTCRQPLVQLLEIIYQVPGLFSCITEALETDHQQQLGNVTPLGWLALYTALHVPGARGDPLMQRMLLALEPRGGGAAAAAAQLKVLLAGLQPAAPPGAGNSNGGSSKSGQAAMPVDGGPQVVTVEDLLQCAGGRNDNDHQDFRDIRVMVTSQEALCQAAPFLPRVSETHLQLSTCPEAALLDQQFRLLREDMVGPLRAELQSLGIATTASNSANVCSSSSSYHVQQGNAVAAAASGLQQSRAASTSWLPAAAAASRNVFQHPAVLGVCLKPRPCIMISIQLPFNHRAARIHSKKERKEFWTSHGHSTLPADALVCLASPGKPLAFATVVRRDPAELAEQQPMVGLAFEPGQESEEMLQWMGQGPLPNTVLVQVSTNFLSSRPVLQCLQSMPCVPLAEEIVHMKAPQHTTYLDRAAVEKDLEQLSAALDPSQYAALRQALNLRVSLIQGPPGTGKTFTSVVLCETILKHSSEKILCVCYTNHALDQFLEALLDKGVKGIVRIGSRSKSKRLEEYNLRELAAKARGQTLNLAESRRLRVLHSELDGVYREVQYLADLLTATAAPVVAAAAPSANGSGSSGSSSSSNRQDGRAATAAAAAKGQAANEAWQARSRQLKEEQDRTQQKRLAAARQRGNPGWADATPQDEAADHGLVYDEWADGIEPYLQAEHPASLEQLQVPAAMTKTKGNYLWNLWLKGAKNKGGVDRWDANKAATAAVAATGNGWQPVACKGDGSSALKRPISPEVAAATAALARGAPVDLSSNDVLDQLLEDIWALPLNLRYYLARHWRGQLRCRWSAQLGEMQQRAQKLQQELRALHDSSHEALLAAARVIGCTTTGAALHKTLLTSKGIAPRVVLIEEAAEILEAHVLTSLSPETQHLVMIGDHKQLRPKVEHYELSMQAGRGHTLNVSLFERLVLAGCPHSTLAVQHRMHPAISCLIKHTYPALQDHPSVSSRPAVMGLASRVVFLNHSQPELQEAKGGMWKAAAEHQSKVNMHEVGLSAATISFLLQQGYHPEQLVLLTPYLGQLLELQHELSNVVQVLLADMDLKDLRNAALPAELRGITASSSPAGGGSSSSNRGAGGGQQSIGNGSSSAVSPSVPAATGVRVATIDNYQGEEADVVVVSLVRSNSQGRVGFLREPERINVLLSRAKHGLIMIGNAATLRNASNATAQKHWGVVLDQLEASGSIMPGLPAVCQQHNRALPLLDCPAAFNLHAPDGGCTMPCNAKLPCGHTCKLRCHAYDRDHSRQRCEELVLGLCAEGHVTTRLCSHAEAVCKTCVDIRQLLEEEKKNFKKLEWEAAKARAEVDKRKARLSSDVERLTQQLLSLSEQAAARQANVLLEVQKAKLEKELELQKRNVAADLCAWEQQQWQQAQDELQQMELDAQMKAEQAAEEAQQATLQKELERQLQKEQVLKQQLADKQSSLQQLDQQEAAQLQDLENKKRRLEAATQMQQMKFEADARLRGSKHITVAKWRTALAQLAKEGQAGLPAFKCLLQQAAGTESNVLAASPAAQAATETLDVVFNATGLGHQLLSYVGDSKDTSLPVQLPASTKRGLALIAEEKWVDAMGVFTALLQQPPEASESGAGSSGTSIVHALVSICEVQLGIPVTPLPAAHHQQPPPVGGSRPALFKIPMPPSKGPRKHPSETASAAPGPQAGPAPPNHPLQHLAAALAYSNLRTGLSIASGQPCKTLTPTGLTQQQRADAQAVGEALAFLLHPAVSGSSSGSSPAIPSCLMGLAVQLLSVQGKAAFSSVGASGLLAAGAAGGGGAAARGAGSASAAGSGVGGWEARAGTSKALKDLITMTGLEPVKREMFNLADQVALDKERNRSPNSRNYNVRFYGNPGTGKTTVARLYAQLLQELQVMPQAAVEETSGAALVAGGLSEIKEKLKKLQKGGVLFIDEAYQLDPAKNPLGAQVLDYLLPEMENKRGTLVVVLAGYQKPMEENIMAYNEGLPSRFPLLFKFPDYTDDQLLHIFMGQLAAGAPAFTLEDAKYASIAVRRLGRQRDSGAPGFGNARAVRNLLEASISRQSARVLEEKRAGMCPELLLLKRDDLLGPKELDVSGSEALQQLARLRGLRAVKSSVDTLLGLIRTNAELEELERPLKEVCLNRVFLGNPGTGKTTVAGIYGRILRDLGLLSKGDVLVKVPADFIGSVLGESEKKTLAVLEEARGCVLVIDEAYGLHSSNKAKDPFKEAVIDTIVAKVQGGPGDDRCVLLLGYPDQMEAMMREANPGLARRFQLTQAWMFEDYGKEDLLHITKETAQRRFGWELGWPELSAALHSLEQERRRPNFGNAGAVQNLLSTAALRMEARVSHLPPQQRVTATPVPQDFMSESDAAAAAAAAAGQAGVGAEAVFSDLIGCQSVLAKLREWQATIAASLALGKDPLDCFELNFTFVGAPGTGKTTVARRVGMLFKQLGLLGSDAVLECSAGDFVTGYVNQSAGKTRELFGKALGQVLFIDEAYRLNPRYGGQFMSEVLDEICQILTDRKFMGKMVVVLAGYEQQIQELLAMNPGLKSRFSERLVFPDFSAADAVQLLQLQLERQYALELSEEALEQLPVLMQQLIAAPGWSNGRDIGTWVKRIFRAYSLRLAGTQAATGSPALLHSEAITPADLQRSLKDFLASKKGPQSTDAAGTMEPSSASNNPWDDFAQAVAQQEAPAPPAVSTSTAKAAAPPPVAEQQLQGAASDEQNAAPEGSASAAAIDFAGLDNAFLADMQEALESLGCDLTSASMMQQLADDPALAQTLLPLLGGSSAAAVERVRQWQQAIQQQLEQERELAKQRQRPVWRCAACGRYGCRVAPYIERYEEC